MAPMKNARGTKESKTLELAERLLHRENARGKSFAAVRLSLQTWPESPFGFRAMQVPGVTVIKPLVTFPAEDQS